MTLSALGLALASTTAALGPADRDLRIEAVWTDMVGCASDPRGVAAAVDDVLRPLRLDVRWREARPSDAVGPDEVRVVVMVPTKWAHDMRVLGACIPTSVAPTIWVEYDNVLRTLGLPPDPQDQDDRERLTLALARVIAHELVHVEAPEYRHDEKGLLAPWLDRRGLVAPEMGWSPNLVRWFRERRGRARRKTSPKPEALTAAPAPEMPAAAGRTH